MANEMSRESLQEIVRLLGRTQSALTSRLGDTDRHPAALLGIEAALCRLRGATLFFDDDFGTSLGLTFGSDDRVGFGIQGGKLAIDSTSTTPFPSFSGSNAPYWSPLFDGPPSPEGWGIWNYNAWRLWRPTPLTAQGEPATPPDPAGAQRLSFGYPVRWTGSAYERAPLFESARFLSIKLPPRSALASGGGAAGTISLTCQLPKNALDGCQITDAVRGVPRDFVVAFLPFLIQGRSNDTQAGTWLSAAINPAPIPAPLPLVTSRLDNTSATHFTLTLSLPAEILAAYDASASAGLYWHVILYWGSRDPFALASLPPYGEAVTLAPAARSGAVSSTILGARKNFFRTRLPDRQGWQMMGVTDNRTTGQPPYLVARGRTHFTFTDGGYSDPTPPRKYRLPAAWPDYAAGGGGWTAGNNGSLASYLFQRGAVGAASLPAGHAVCGVILVKTTGQSAVGQSVPAVLLGPVVTPEFFPSGGWETCPYFPPVPQDFVAVGRFVLQRSPALAEARGETVLGVTPPALIPGIAVAWYQQVPITHARGPIGDPSLSQLLLRRLQSAAERLRTASAPFFAADAAFQILPEAVGFPAALASRRTDLSAAPDGRAATVFRGLFKRPSADSLKVREDGEPLAIPFEADGIALLDLMTGKATSTELMRFESNRLDLLPTRLVRAQPLEIFHEATDQCSRADVNGSGAKIGRDYTLRLLMEDDDENTYDKTLYVTASTFFLSPDEWAKREAMGLSLIGYRKLANLPEITEWRRNGYAGLIPDLVMGQSRPLLTRQVSPPDPREVTYAAFVANLKNQGLSDSAIVDAVEDFENGGGVFYVVDTDQYPAAWLAVRSASVAVSTYSFDDVPYWTATPTLTNGINVCDAFLIARSGLSSSALETSTSPPEPVYGAFLRDDGFTQGLAPANRQRESGSVYKVDGYWSFAAEKGGVAKRFPCIPAPSAAFTAPGAETCLWWCGTLWAEKSTPT